MITCNDFAERLDLYLDHRLARDEQLSVDRHLHDCDACSALAGRHQERQVILRTAVTDVVAAVDVSGLWGAVHRAIEHDVPAKRVRAWWVPLRDWLRGAGGWTAPAWLTPLRLTGWAAAAVAAIVFVAFGLRAPGTPRVQVAERQPAVSMSKPGSQLHNVRVDSLQASEGHTVATWMQPHTGAQIIWVADADAAAGR